MKKFLHIIFALALLATSCESGDFTTSTSSEEEVDCTITVVTPELKTRAADPSGSGAYAIKLAYCIYDETGETHLMSGRVDCENDQFVITRKLVKDRTYRFFFFAYNGETQKPYQQRFTYTDNIVKVIEKNCLANQDSYDVFSRVIDITVGIDPGIIYLYRPTAQLNIVTADVDEAEEVGAPIVTSWIDCKMVTTFNFEGEKTVVDDTFTFQPAAIPTHSVTIGDGSDAKEYRVISMNYIMMKNTDKEFQDITLYWSEAADGSNPVSRTFENIPLQRNYRTYIVGDLLTVNGSYTLTVLPIMDPASDETVTVSAR